MYWQQWQRQTSMSSLLWIMLLIVYGTGMSFCEGFHSVMRAVALNAISSNSMGILDIAWFSRLMNLMYHTCTSLRFFKELYVQAQGRGRELKISLLTHARLTCELHMSHASSAQYSWSYIAPSLYLIEVWPFFFKVNCLRMLTLLNNTTIIIIIIIIKICNMHLSTLLGARGA